MQSIPISHLWKFIYFYSKRLFFIVVVYIDQVYLEKFTLCNLTRLTKVSSDSQYLYFKVNCMYLVFLYYCGTKIVSCVCVCVCVCDWLTDWQTDWLTDWPVRASTSGSRPDHGMCTLELVHLENRWSDLNTTRRAKIRTSWWTWKTARKKKRVIWRISQHARPVPVLAALPDYSPFRGTCTSRALPRGRYELTCPSTDPFLNCAPAKCNENLLAWMIQSYTAWTFFAQNL